MWKTDSKFESCALSDHHTIVFSSNLNEERVKTIYVFWELRKFIFVDRENMCGKSA